MNEKQKKQKQFVKKNNRKIKFYYSFLTVVLLVCLAQVIRSAVLNISKILNYNVKVKKMLIIKENVEQEHESLVSKIENFSTLKGVEAIARNNLKLAKPDEILVIVNELEQKSENVSSTQEENDKNLKASVWIKLQDSLKVRTQKEQ